MKFILRAAVFYFLFLYAVHVLGKFVVLERPGHRECISISFLVTIYIVKIYSPDLTQLPFLPHPKGINIQSKPAFNDEGVIQVKLNDPVSLVCTLGVTKAEEELVWLRNDAAVLLKEGNNKNRSSLCVTPTYEDNGAKFTCHQKGNSTDQVSVTLNVTCKSP